MMKRPRGRPAIGQAITFRIEAWLHDDICREALARDVPVARVLRERLRITAPEKQKAQQPA